jgi:hypothetical protein
VGSGGGGLPVVVEAGQTQRFHDPKNANGDAAHTEKKPSSPGTEAVPHSTHGPCPCPPGCMGSASRVEASRPPRGAP